MAAHPASMVPAQSLERALLWFDRAKALQRLGEGLREIVFSALGR